MSEYKENFNFIDLAAQQKIIREKIDLRIADVLNHGTYIMGPEVRDFEERLKEFLNVKHALTCANGTDALTIALMALDIKSDDIVMVPSFTYVATAETVAQLKAKPYFLDVDDRTYNVCPESLERSILSIKSKGQKVACLIGVDLFGEQCNHKNLSDICKKYGIKFIVDAAQSFGSQVDNMHIGCYGDITTTSFFPAKPLGCYGDGGAIFTNDEELSKKINSIRLHGKGSHKYQHINIGVNSRLDTLQAAILLEKLAIFPDEMKKRKAISEYYNKRLEHDFICPKLTDNSISAWAQYTIQAENRDKIKSYLAEKNIPTVVYYPIPLHMQDAYKDCLSDPDGLLVSEILPKKVLSLPMHPYLSKEDQDIICDSLLEANNSEV